MSIKNTVFGLLAASALLISAAPSLASAQSYPYVTNCGYGYNYQYQGIYPYNQYQNCNGGTLLVFVQVNAPVNSLWSVPASSFSISVSGNNVYPSTVQGANTAQPVSVSGSYAVNAASYQGFTATYSSGCTGSLVLGQTATCVVTETPVNMPNYNNQYPYGYNNTYPYNYQYPYNNQPTVYVTPTYVPRLPNTGFEPQNGAALAFAAVALIAAAFLALPYVRKALAIISR